MKQAKATDKKEILKEVNGFPSKYDLEGDINEVAERIKALPKKLLESYPNNEDFKKCHRFSVRQDTEYGYGDDPSETVFILQCYRWETDEELKARLELSEKRSIAAKEREITKKAAKTKREKTLYENLKKKFEN